MYVIEIGGTPAIAGVGKRANVARYIPADRCVWEIADDVNGGYNIDNVRVIVNAFSPTQDINVTTFPGVTLRFGFIGKSGRFVEMA